MVKVAPSSNIRASDTRAPGSQPIGQLTRMPAESIAEVAVPAVESGDDIVQRAQHLVFTQREDARQHRSRPRILMLEAFLPRHEQPGDDS